MTDIKTEYKRLQKLVFLFDQRNNEIARNKERQELGSKKKIKWVNRAVRINRRFMENVRRGVKPLELNAVRDENRVTSLESRISNLNKMLQSLVEEICMHNKNKFLGLTERIRENASAQIAILEPEAIKIRVSIDKLKEELLTLKQIADVSLEKAKSLREEMGDTLVSFISYLERLKKRIQQETDESFLDDELNYFKKTHECILSLDQLITDVDSNLKEIHDTVEKGSREAFPASFDISTKRVNLDLISTFQYITIEQYLDYLKTTRRPKDVKNIEKRINSICSKIIERIETRSVLDSEVEHLRCKIKYYKELLAEKKRMCK